MEPKEAVRQMEAAGGKGFNEMIGEAHHKVVGGEASPQRRRLVDGAAEGDEDDGQRHESPR